MNFKQRFSGSRTEPQEFARDTHSLQPMHPQSPGGHDGTSYGAPVGSWTICPGSRHLAGIFFPPARLYVVRVGWLGVIPSAHGGSQHTAHFFQGDRPTDCLKFPVGTFSLS